MAEAGSESDDDATRDTTVVSRSPDRDDATTPDRPDDATVVTGGRDIPTQAGPTEHESPGADAWSPSSSAAPTTWSQPAQDHPGQAYPGQGQPGQGQPGQWQPGQAQPAQWQPPQGQPTQWQPPHGPPPPGQWPHGQGSPGQWQGAGHPSGPFPAAGASTAGLWARPADQGGAPPSYPGQPGAAPGDDDGRRKRRRLIIAAVAGVVVIALIVAVAVVLVSGAPDRAVRNAAQGTGAWSGVTYRGQVVDAGAPASVELTVDNQGNGSGSITRSGGGRADIIVTPTTQAIRGDAQWWAKSAPRPSLAVRLVDRWVSGAREQLPGVDGWSVSPAALAASLTGEKDWSGGGTQQVGPVEADAYADGADRALVGPDGRLVGVELPAFGRQRVSPVGVEQATPDALQRVTTAMGQVPSMPDYTATINEPARLATPTWAPTEAPCTTPICTENVTLANQGQWPASGTAQFLLNGQVTSTHPFTLDPGAVQTFPMTYPNAAPAGQSVTVYTRVQLIDVN